MGERVQGKATDPYGPGTADHLVGLTSEIRFQSVQKDTVVVDDLFGVVVMTPGLKKGWGCPWRGVMRAALRLIDISPNARAELRAALAKWGDA
jgi:DNA-directed RNA polymerase subunit F